MGTVHDCSPEGSKRSNRKVENAVSACALALVVLTTVSARAQTASVPTQARLRYSEPLEVVTRDLEAFVPDFMARESVPGVAIAVIRDGRTAWVRGFGSANRWND